MMSMHVEKSAFSTAVASSKTGADANLTPRSHDSTSVCTTGSLSYDMNDLEQANERLLRKAKKRLDDNYRSSTSQLLHQRSATGAAKKSQSFIQKVVSWHKDKKIDKIRSLLSSLFPRLQIAEGEVVAWLEGLCSRKDMAWASGQLLLGQLESQVDLFQRHLDFLEEVTGDIRQVNYDLLREVEELRIAFAFNQELLHSSEKHSRSSGPSDESVLLSLSLFGTLPVAGTSGGTIAEGGDGGGTSNSCRRAIACDEMIMLRGLASSPFAFNVTAATARRVMDASNSPPIPADTHEEGWLEHTRWQRQHQQQQQVGARAGIERHDEGRSRGSSRGEEEAEEEDVIIMSSAAAAGRQRSRSSAGEAVGHPSSCPSSKALGAQRKSELVWDGCNQKRKSLMTSNVSVQALNLAGISNYAGANGATTRSSINAADSAAPSPSVTAGRIVQGLFGSNFTGKRSVSPPPSSAESGRQRAFTNPVAPVSGVDGRVSPAPSSSSSSRLNEGSNSGSNFGLGLSLKSLKQLGVTSSSSASSSSSSHGGVKSERDLSRSPATPASSGDSRASRDSTGSVSSLGSLSSQGERRSTGSKTVKRGGGEGGGGGGGGGREQPRSQRLAYIMDTFSAEEVTAQDLRDPDQQQMVTRMNKCLQMKDTLKDVLCTIEMTQEAETGYMKGLKKLRADLKAVLESSPNVSDRSFHHSCSYHGAHSESTAPSTAPPTLNSMLFRQVSAGGASSCGYASSSCESECSWDVGTIGSNTLPTHHSGSSWEHAGLEDGCCKSVQGCRHDFYRLCSSGEASAMNSVCSSLDQHDSFDHSHRPSQGVASTLGGGGGGKGSEAAACGNSNESSASLSSLCSSARSISPMVEGAHSANTAGGGSKLVSGSGSGSGPAVGRQQQPNVPQNLPHPHQGHGHGHGHAVHPHQYTHAAHHHLPQKLPHPPVLTHGHSVGVGPTLGVGSSHHPPPQLRPVFSVGFGQSSSPDAGMDSTSNHHEGASGPHFYHNDHLAVSNHIYGGDGSSAPIVPAHNSSERASKAEDTDRDSRDGRQNLAEHLHLTRLDCSDTVSHRRSLGNRSSSDETLSPLSPHSPVYQTSLRDPNPQEQAHAVPYNLHHSPPQDGAQTDAPSTPAVAVGAAVSPSAAASAGADVGAPHSVTEGGGSSSDAASGAGADVCQQSASTEGQQLSSFLYLGSAHAMSSSSGGSGSSGSSSGGGGMSLSSNSISHCSSGFSFYSEAEAVHSGSGLWKLGIAEIDEEEDEEEVAEARDGYEEDVEDGDDEDDDDGLVDTHFAATKSKRGLGASFPPNPSSSGAPSAPGEIYLVGTDCELEGGPQISTAAVSSSPRSAADADAAAAAADNIGGTSSRPVSGLTEPETDSTPKSAASTAASTAALWRSEFVGEREEVAGEAVGKAADVGSAVRVMVPSLDLTVRTGSTLSTSAAATASTSAAATVTVADHNDRDCSCSAGSAISPNLLSAHRCNSLSQMEIPAELITFEQLSLARGDLPASIANATASTSSSARAAATATATATAVVAGNYLTDSNSICRRDARDDKSSRSCGASGGDRLGAAREFVVDLKSLLSEEASARNQLERVHVMLENAYSIHRKLELPLPATSPSATVPATSGSGSGLAPVRGAAATAAAPTPAAPVLPCPTSSARRAAGGASSVSLAATSTSTSTAALGNSSSRAGKAT